MKKKIIFMLIDMNIGGTEKALLNLIAEIPKEDYDITILMLEENGGFIENIPSYVHVEFFKGYKHIKDDLNQPPHTIALNYLVKGQLIKSLKIAYLHLISKLTNDRSLYYYSVFKDYPVSMNVYDVAVAYAGPVDFISYFVLNKIKAKKKIQWIHFDITKVGFNRKFANKAYNKFDKIFVVSSEGRDKLINVIPKLKDKIESFLNILSRELVVKMSNEGNGFDDGFDGIRILTVGRLGKEKGQDLTIPVLARLKKEGYNVRWYCVGEGDAREEYNQLINQYGVTNDFILLGARANPYPYMNQCDLYVQSSRHEGYCITLSEAKCFNTPIVTTRFTGAYEQISHGNTGLIVDIDIQQMFLAVKQLIDEEELRNKFKNELHSESLSTQKEMDKLYRVFDTYRI